MSSTPSDDEPAENVEKKTRSKPVPAVGSLAYRKQRIRDQLKSNLGRLLKERGINQSDLARMLNEHFEKTSVLADPEDPSAGFRKVPAWELSRWANGRITPDADIILAIAKVLGVEADELVVGASADADPNAVVFTTRQLANGRYAWEFQGTVTAETHRKLLLALAEG